MTGGTAEYGALAAKVRALYGKRLRPSDFEHMAVMKSVAEVLDYLRQHPSWGRASAVLSTSGWSYLGRVEAESVLWNELQLEYLSLANFVPRQDRPIMAFQVRLAELHAILDALRRLKAGKYALRPAASRITFRWKLDGRTLAACTTYDQLLESVHNTIYYQPLRRLRPAQNGELPDYTMCECVLRSTYFSHMLGIIRKQYRGETQKILLRSYGEQIDMLNLIHILRLKTFFPETSKDACLAMLYPFNYRLRPEQLRSLCEAQDPESVLALISRTPYASNFEGARLGEAELYYRRAFYAFNKRQLLTGAPSVYTAMAYLNMKELELHGLVTIIESVKYGVPCNLDLVRPEGA